MSGGWRFRVIIVLFALSTLSHIATSFKDAARHDELMAKLDALQSTADQTVDFLSDLHAEKEKAR